MYMYNYVHAQICTWKGCLEYTVRVDLIIMHRKRLGESFLISNQLYKSTKTILCNI